MDDLTGNWLGALGTWTTTVVARASGDRDQSAVAALLTCRYFSDVTVGELAPLLGLTGSGAVRLVDRLETEGLVSRRPTGGRAVVVRLTRRGRAEAMRLAQRRADCLTGMLDVLEPAERRTLATLVTKLLHDAELDPASARSVCRFCDHGRCDGARCPVGTSLEERGEPRAKADARVTTTGAGS